MHAALKSLLASQLELEFMHKQTIDHLKEALHLLNEFEKKSDWYYFSLALESLLQAIENETKN
jgi:hypothetical protein